MKIKINFDVANKDWDLDESQIDPFDDYVDFYFNFRNAGSEQVEFNTLRFGYVVLDNEIPVGGEEFPRAGFEYLATDQLFLEVSRVFGFRPNRSYQIDLWAENNGESFSESIIFNIPIPEQPYPSWTWDDDTAEWIAPFPPPDDGNMYKWNESSQSWDLFVIE